jgi:phenylacetate-CoA ligase
VLQGYATADLGTLAYECVEKKGLHLQPEAIVEILDLETGQPAAPGQPGLVVATTFDKTYPLLRFAPGDISALASEAACPCGRTARKLTGLLGRVGDAVKVKGMFIRGTQMDEVFKKFSQVTRFQAVITRDQHHDQLSYLVEVSEPIGDTAWIARLEEALREALKVRGEARIVPTGTIAAGAKKIADQRVWR